MRISLAAVPFVLLVAVLMSGPARAQTSPAHAEIDASALDRVAEGFRFAEGPLIDPGTGTLLFTDAEGDAIFRLKADGTVDTVQTPAGHPAGIAFDLQGQLLVAQNGNRRLVRLGAEGSETVIADTFEGNRLNSPNDLAVRSDGMIYFTDPTFGIDPAFGAPTESVEAAKEVEPNGVYRITADGTLHLEVADFIQPNGIAFSPDERVLYVNDSGRRHIRAFQVAMDGTLSGGAVFAEMPGDEGDWAADGMRTDRAGNVYSAGAKGVWVFSPEGQLRARIYGPEVITNLAIDEEQGVLYLTGMRALYRLPLDRLSGV